MDATPPSPDASTATDSGARADARRDAGPIGVEPSGCGCAVPAATPSSGVFGMMLSLVALAREARRRRRHA
jgi:MYXO-CTERM domain-containing protein